MISRGAALIAWKRGEEQEWITSLPRDMGDDGCWSGAMGCDGASAALSKLERMLHDDSGRAMP